MIFWHHCGLVLLFIACFTTFDYTDSLNDNGIVLQRFKRENQDDPKAYLDQVISYWIFKIPVLIDISVAQSEKDLTLTVAKRVTQVCKLCPKIVLFLSQRCVQIVKELFFFACDLTKHL